MKKRRSVDSRHDDRGASLILALAVMIAISGIVAGLVTFLDSSYRVGAALQASRNRQYAADGAVEQAIRLVQDDTVAKALIGTNCSQSQPSYTPTAPINGYAVRVACQGAPSATLDSLNRTVIQRNVIFLACVAPGSTPPATCDSSAAIVKAKVNFPTNAAGAVTGAFVQSWSVN